MMPRIVDGYVRKARVYPIALTLLPSLVYLNSWLAWEHEVFISLSSMALAVGVVFFAADLSRHAGKTVEKNLLDEWGGWPTTLMLRYSDATFSQQEKKRYHDFIAKQLGIEAPEEDLEKQEPKRADEFYRQAANWLRNQTRDTNVFQLLQEENRTYGFRRNLFGLRPYGITINLFILTASLLPYLDSIDLYTRQYLIAPTSPAGAISSFILVISFIFLVSKSYVRAAADQYAKTLIESCERLIPGN